MKDFSSRLKEAMVFKNISQAELVRRTGISKGALSSYLSGKYDPKQNNVYILSKALNCNPLYLLGYTDDPIDYDSDEYGDIAVPPYFMPEIEDTSERVRLFIKFQKEEDARILNEDSSIDPRFNDFKFALLHGENDLSEDQKQDLLDYYEFIKSKKR